MQQMNGWQAQAQMEGTACAAAAAAAQPLAPLPPCQPLQKPPPPSATAPRLSVPSDAQLRRFYRKHGDAAASGSTSGGASRSASSSSAAAAAAAGARDRELSETDLPALRGLCLYLLHAAPPQLFDKQVRLHQRTAS